MAHNTHTSVFFCLTWFLPPTRGLSNKRPYMLTTAPGVNTPQWDFVGVLPGWLSVHEVNVAFCPTVQQPSSFRFLQSIPWDPGSMRSILGFSVLLLKDTVTLTLGSSDSKCNRSYRPSVFLSLYVCSQQISQKLLFFVFLVQGFEMENTFLFFHRWYIVKEVVTSAVFISLQWPCFFLLSILMECWSPYLFLLCSRTTFSSVMKQTYEILRHRCLQEKPAEGHCLKTHTCVLPAWRSLSSQTSPQHPGTVYLYRCTFHSLL